MFGSATVTSGERQSKFQRKLLDRPLDTGPSCAGHRYAHTRAQPRLTVVRQCPTASRVSEANSAGSMEIKWPIECGRRHRCSGRRGTAGRPCRRRCCSASQSLLQIANTAASDRSGHCWTGRRGPSAADRQSGLSQPAAITVIARVSDGG